MKRSSKTKITVTERVVIHVSSPDPVSCFADLAEALEPIANRGDLSERSVTVRLNLQGIMPCQFKLLGVSSEEQIQKVQAREERMDAQFKQSIKPSKHLIEKM